jgi:Raf kinase inhibitor-like YbhB/YbcL family protein
MGVFFALRNRIKEDIKGDSSMTMLLASNDFEDRSFLDQEFTFQGKSISPELNWSGIPSEARELALVCEDPDAPLPKPFIHWITYGIDPSINALPRALPRGAEIESPVRLFQGRNSFGFFGYVGPNPPFWHGSHRYTFRLIALKEPSGLKPGAGRREFFQAIHGKILEETQIVGLYEKSPAEKGKAIAFWAASIIGFGGVGLLAKHLIKDFGKDLIKQHLKSRLL